MGLGEALSLACALAWASAVVLYKYAGDSMSANTLNLVKNIIGLALLIPTMLILEGFSVPSLTITEWLILIASGYFGIAVADTLYLQALRVIGASRTAIVASLYSPFVVILSIVFLAETLLSWQWFGFALVLIGIMVVVYQRQSDELETTVLVKGAVMAAVSVFLTAAGVVAMKPVLVNDGFFWMVSLRMAAGVLGMMIFIAIRRKIKSTYEVVRYGEHKWKVILIASTFGSYLALMFWLGGFKFTEASVASVLNETANVFIVLMAAIFLNEVLTKRKLFGVGFTFTGVVIFLGVLG